MPTILLLIGVFGGCRPDEREHEVLSKRPSTGEASRPGPRRSRQTEPVRPTPPFDEPDASTPPPVGTPDPGIDPRAPLVVRCNDVEATPASTTACTATGTVGSLLIRAIVLAGGTIFEQGEVFIDTGGTIRCVGCDCAARHPATAMLTCRHAIVSPALINAHDHVSYATTAPVAITNRYTHRHEWRLGLEGRERLRVDGGASRNQLIAQELRMLFGGATATVGAGGIAGLVRNLDDERQSRDLGVLAADSDTFPLDDTSGKLRPSGCEYGRFPSAPKTFESVGAYVPHLAEGIGATATNELSCALGELDLVPPRTAIVHAMAPTLEHVRELATRRARVIWSPRSNLALYGDTAPVTLLDALGVPLALGTDWLATGSMNVLRELRCAKSFNERHLSGYFSDYQLWQMVTARAALAAGVERALGALAPGMLGDIALFVEKDHSAHQAVVDAEPKDVLLVLRAGEPLFGEAHLIETLSPTPCEAFELCGSARHVCLRDVDVTLAALLTDETLPYPLWSCGEPELEPACAPRTASGGLATPSDDDSDGDGVPNARDVCPGIFDAELPGKPAYQADQDGDGVGDVCDPCPFDVDDDCAPSHAMDLDGDGATDSADNCPEHANADQADGDADGWGDVCDPCPLPNAGYGACVLSVPAVRNPGDALHPQLGARVEVSAVASGLVADSASSAGFFAGVPHRADGGGPRQGAAFSALFVYTRDRRQLPKVGEWLQLRGFVDDYYGTTELVSPAWQLVELDAPLEALVVDDPAALAMLTAESEPLESVLITVRDVAVIVENADAPRDYDEFVISGGLRVDDRLLPELDNTYAAGTRFRSITGIFGYAFGNTKLWPRSFEDIVLESP